jgi:iron(III) transport system ATP-binding protein
MTTPDNNPHLTMLGITKRYGDFLALDSINFSADKGEMLCLLGPSGCGKTTALRIIAGLEAEHDGRVFIAGEDVSMRPVSKRNIGIVFQSYALFPNLNAIQNVSYGLVSAGIRGAKAKARANELLELVGLPGVGRKYPAQLSGGQQQRVALARAMALSPEILLLDEPLSALDAQVRIHLRTEIKRLQRELGVTTIMVTHDQEEGMTMGDRILLMKDGKIIQDAPPGQLYDQPVSTFAAAFLGSMNFLPATDIGDTSHVGFGNKGIAVAENAWKKSDLKGCLLAIRPEDLIVQAAGTDNNGLGNNTLKGQVASLEFRGPLYRLTLRLDNAPEDCPEVTADVSARVAGRLDLTENAPVQVVLPPDLVHVYNG